MFAATSSDSRSRPKKSRRSYSESPNAASPMNGERGGASCDLFRGSGRGQPLELLGVRSSETS